MPANCSLSTVYALIAAAIAMLLAAMALALFWVAAVPLFIAAALVAGVAYGIIPALKNALNAYAQCRGQSDKCTISLGIDTLGQAAGTISAVAFLLAGIMEVAALGFLYTWFLAWIGVSIQAAVAAMVKTGLYSCAVTILILVGVLTDANSFKSCMDQQGSGPATGGGAVIQ